MRLDAHHLGEQDVGRLEHLRGRHPHQCHLRHPRGVHPEPRLQVHHLERRPQHLLRHLLHALSPVDRGRVELERHLELRRDELHLVVQVHQMRVHVVGVGRVADEPVEQERGVAEVLVDVGGRLPALERRGHDGVLDDELLLHPAHLRDVALHAPVHVLRLDLLDRDLGDLRGLHPETLLRGGDLLQHLERLGVDVDGCAVLDRLGFDGIDGHAHRVAHDVDLGDEVRGGLVDVARRDVARRGLRRGGAGRGEQCEAAREGRRIGSYVHLEIPPSGAEPEFRSCKGRRRDPAAVAGCSARTATGGPNGRARLVFGQVPHGARTGLGPCARGVAALLHFWGLAIARAPLTDRGCRSGG